MAPMMDPEEDYITIAATEQQTSTTKSNRKKELEEAYSNLKGGWIHKSRLLDFDANTSLVALVRVLDSARTSATRPSTVPTATDHRATVNELDATRLSLAKAINEAESSLASREAELASLKEEAKVLEECDPAAEHERELNGTTSVFVSLPLSGTDLVWWSGCDYKYIRGWALSPSRIKMADLLRCSFVSRLKNFPQSRPLSDHCPYIRCRIGRRPLRLVRWQSQIQCRIYRSAVEASVFLISHFLITSIVRP